MLPNNVFYWRVRAIDQDGNFGLWNVGPDFDKTFDTVVPPHQEPAPARERGGIDRDRLDDQVPIVVWDPVPGASSYQVQVGPYVGVCDFNPADTSRLLEHQHGHDRLDAAR